MRLGDLFEWAAAGCLVYAAYVWSGQAMAFLAGAVSLGYMAQCYSDTPLGVAAGLGAARNAAKGVWGRLKAVRAARKARVSS